VNPLIGGGRGGDGPGERPLGVVAAMAGDGGGRGPGGSAEDGGFRMRLLVVSDQPAFAQGLQALLEGELEAAQISTLTAPFAAPRLASAVAAEVVLLSLSSPADGTLQIIYDLRALPAPPLVIAVVAGDDTAAAVGAVGAGAVGVLSSDAGVDQVVSAVRLVARGGTWLSADLLSSIVKRLQVTEDGSEEGTSARMAQLTDRELDVLRLMVNGLNRAAISARLYRSPNTVRTHIGNIMAKMGAHSTAEAVAIALREGMRPDAIASVAPPSAWVRGS
jgi:DNA-binding NarL/FixJ family response regulator